MFSVTLLNKLIQPNFIRYTIRTFVYKMHNALNTKLKTFSFTMERQCRQPNIVVDTIITVKHLINNGHKLRILLLIVQRQCIKLISMANLFKTLFRP